MCMLGTIGLSYANNCACKDELTVQAQASGNEKTDMSSFISANINGHYLTVAFLANLGEVTIEIFDDSGLLSDIAFMETPTGYQYYIPQEGRYTLFITLQDGDMYYADFEVND